MLGFCDACREMVRYTEKIARCTNCSQNIFISAIVDENLETIYKTYREISKRCAIID